MAGVQRTFNKCQKAKFTVPAGVPMRKLIVRPYDSSVYTMSSSHADQTQIFCISLLSQQCICLKGLGYHLPLGVITGTQNSFELTDKLYLCNYTPSQQISDLCTLPQFIYALSSIMPLGGQMENRSTLYYPDTSTKVCVWAL